MSVNSKDGFSFKSYDQTPDLEITKSNKVNINIFNKSEINPVGSATDQQLEKLQMILKEGFTSFDLRNYDKNGPHNINVLLEGNHVQIQILKSDGSKLLDKKAVIHEAEKRIMDIFKKESLLYVKPAKALEKGTIKPADRVPNIQKPVDSVKLATQRVVHPIYPKGHELEGVKGPESKLAEYPPICLIGPQKKEDSGFSSSQIEHSYSINEQQVGHQTIQRYDSVDKDIEFCKNMISFLKKKGLHETDRSAMQSIQNKIEFYHLELQKALELKEKGEGWLNSNYFRNLVKKYGYNNALDHYSAQPINMRYQQLEVNGQQEMGFFRVGVMSDMSNGWFSVSDLENMRNNPKAVLEMIKRIEGKWKLRSNQKESAAHAIRQLKSLLIKGNNNELIIDQAIFENLMGQRKMFLEKQMMHLLCAQVDKNQTKIKQALGPDGNREFAIAHLGLLNPKKVELDKTGWMHDERVEIEDMQAIYKEFQGKVLVFDGSGPLIDGDTIHLPYKFDNISPDQAKINLNTYFFNISPQGYIENDGMQQVLNRNEMNRLMENPQYKAKMNQKIRDQMLGLEPIQSHEKGYPVAEELAVSLSSLVDGLSLGCLSAKDRTGFVGERCMLRKLPPPYTDHEQFRRQIFDSNGPAVRVVQENTPDVRALKVNPSSNLPGYTSTDKPGILWRTVKASI